MVSVFTQGTKDNRNKTEDLLTRNQGSPFAEEIHVTFKNNRYTIEEDLHCKYPRATYNEDLPGKSGE